MSKKSILTACQREADDRNAGQLLFELRGHYRKPAKLYEYEGCHWVIYTREQWMAIVGLTRNQYNRALAILKRKGLVAVRYDFHPYRRRVFRATWMRPDYRLSAAADNPPSAPSDNSPSVREDHPYIEDGKKTEKDGNQLAPTSGAESKHMNVKPIGKKDLPETLEEAPQPSKPKKTHEEVAQKQQALVKLTSQAELSIGEAIALWQLAVAKHNGGYQPMLTQKQAGQMKHLLAKLHEFELHEGELLSWAVREWISLAKHVAIMDGANNPPLKPNIGFLLQHLSEAVVYADPGETPVSPPVTDAPKSDTSVTAIPGSTYAPPLTPEEIAQLEKDAGL